MGFYIFKDLSVIFFREKGHLICDFIRFRLTGDQSKTYARVIRRLFLGKGGLALRIHIIKTR